MNESGLLNNYLLIGSLLFAIGMAGFLVRRNLIVTFLCVEMMLQGVSLSFAAWGRFHQDWGGQMMVIFMITIAACEAAIALALILMVFYQSHTLDIVFWQDLREPGQPRFVDQHVPEERVEDRVWPRLPPAGIAPEPDLEAEGHRAHV